MTAATVEGRQEARTNAAKPEQKGGRNHLSQQAGGGERREDARGSLRIRNTSKARDENGEEKCHDANREAPGTNCPELNSPRSPLHFSLGLRPHFMSPNAAVQRRRAAV